MTKFPDLGLKEEILKAVADTGYTTPTDIQAQAIPIILQGNDLFGCAQTGTGKTASFILPMIDTLSQGRARSRMPRSLVLEPTRELAAQVAENFTTYGKYTNLNLALLIGGESFAEQEKALNKGVDVLIATPGRLLDLFERGKILLADVKIMVIDEADRMLDMGFIPDVEKIVRTLPTKRQTLLFSATMPTAIRKLADTFLKNPQEIVITPASSTAITIQQFGAHVPMMKKREALRHLFRTEPWQCAIIFCNRKKDVTVVSNSLKRHGFSADALHGDLTQSQRMQTLESFKAGEIKILVASDVAARGLDIDEVSHVVNFDVPLQAEDYVHRIGRTGRAGREGKAFTLITKQEETNWKKIQELTGTEIPMYPELETLYKVEAAEETPAKGRRKTSNTKGTALGEVAPMTENKPAKINKPESSRPITPRHANPRQQGTRNQHNRHTDFEIDSDPLQVDVKGFGLHMPAFFKVEVPYLQNKPGA